MKIQQVRNIVTPQVGVEEEGIQNIQQVSFDITSQLLRKQAGELKHDRCVSL